MSSSFPAILSKLRKIKGISQRKAAEDLNISQALLSHYENGIREPGLDFLLRVGQYYGVSLDYLLGRTDVRQNPFLAENLMPKYSVGLADDVLTTLNEETRLIVLALTTIFNTFARTSGRLGMEYAAKYLKSQIYRLFRIQHLHLNRGGFDFLNLPISEVDMACDAVAKLTCLRLSRFLEETAKEEASGEGSFVFSQKALEERYHATYEGFIEVIKNMDEQLCSNT